MPSLNAISGELGLVNARHLLRRTSFKYTPEQVRTLSNLTITEALNLIFTPPQLVGTPFDPLPEGNPDGYWTNFVGNSSTIQNQERKRIIVSGWWWYQTQIDFSIGHKLTHFLSTRFTVSKKDINASDFYDYLRLLHHYALGNYKELSFKMTYNNAMLVYLNNNLNSSSAPNENYAREFLELFTIGKGPQLAAGNYTNYTEHDIVQAARVLTGIKNEVTRSTLDPQTGIPCGIFEPSLHDSGSKTFSEAFDMNQISGSSSASEQLNELASFVTMVFNKTETAKHICRKIYHYFVSNAISPIIEASIIQPLALILQNNNYELEPVLRSLFASEHFFDTDNTNQLEAIIGGTIKSPLQLFAEINSALELPYPNCIVQPLNYYTQFWIPFSHNTFFAKSDMLLFEPPNVAGHPAYYQAPDFDKTWISSSTLHIRFTIIESLLNGENLYNSNTPIYPQPDLALLFSSSTICSNPEDPFVLTRELCEHFFGQIAPQERYDYFMNTFLLEGQPPIDWTSVWSFYIQANFTTVVNLRLKKLIVAILKAPEAQLF